MPTRRAARLVPTRRAASGTGLALVLLSETRQMHSVVDREAFVIGFAGFSFKDIEEAAGLLGRTTVDLIAITR